MIIEERRYENAERRYEMERITYRQRRGYLVRLFERRDGCYVLGGTYFAPARSRQRAIEIADDDHDAGVEDGALK